MHSQSLSRSGAAASRLIVIAAVVLTLVFATRWLVIHFYSNDWAATDPRSAEGKARLIDPPTAPAEAPVAEPAPTVPYQNFKPPAGK